MRLSRRLWTWWIEKATSDSPSIGLLTPRARARLWQGDVLARVLAALLLADAFAFVLLPAAPTSILLFVGMLSLVCLLAAALNRRGYVDSAGTIVAALFIVALAVNLWVYSADVGGFSWVASQGLDLFAIPVVIAALVLRKRFLWPLIYPLTIITCIALVVLLPEAPDLLRAAIAVHDISPSLPPTAQHIYLHVLILVRPIGLITVLAIVGSFVGPSTLAALEALDEQSGLARSRQQFLDALERQQRRFTELLAGVEQALTDGEPLGLSKAPPTDVPWGGELQTQLHFLSLTLSRLQRAQREAHEGAQAQAAWQHVLETWSALPSHVQHLRQVGYLPFGEAIQAGRIETAYPSANIALQALADYENYADKELRRCIEAVEQTVDAFLDGDARARVDDAFQGNILWSVALKINVLLDAVRLTAPLRIPPQDRPGGDPDWQLHVHNEGG